MDRSPAAAVVDVDGIANAVTGRLPAVPRMMMIAGSGIMEAIRDIPVLADIPYTDLPTMPVPTIAGHGGSLRLVDVDGIPVGIFTGRFHHYEGWPHDVITAPVRIAHALRCSHLLVTNAAGGLSPLFDAGDVMMVDDVIDATFRMSMAIGTAIPVDGEWTAHILQEALRSGIAPARGIYVQVAGPSYETRAEIRMYRRMGAEAIGMSTSRELRHAASLGLKTAACSMITNVLSDSSIRKVTHDEVLETARTGAGRLLSVVRAAAHTVDTPLPTE